MGRCGVNSATRRPTHRGVSACTPSSLMIVSLRRDVAVSLAIPLQVIAGSLREFASEVRKANDETFQNLLACGIDKRDAIFLIHLDVSSPEEIVSKVGIALVLVLVITDLERGGWGAGQRPEGGVELSPLVLLLYLSLFSSPSVSFSLSLSLATRAKTSSSSCCMPPIPWRAASPTSPVSRPRPPRSSRQPKRPSSHRRSRPRVSWLAKEDLMGACERGRQVNSRRRASRASRRPAGSAVGSTAACLRRPRVVPTPESQTPPTRTPMPPPNPPIHRPISGSSTPSRRASSWPSTCTRRTSSTKREGGRRRRRCPRASSRSRPRRFPSASAFRGGARMSMCRSRGSRTRKRSSAASRTP